jgi:hypothetical protein
MALLLLRLPPLLLLPHPAASMEQCQSQSTGMCARYLNALPPTTTLAPSRPVSQPDDNSCLFHAVSFLLSPWSSTQELRQTVVQSVRSDPVRWDVATLGRPIEEYLAYISDDSRWGGQVGLL